MTWPRASDGTHQPPAAARNAATLFGVSAWEVLASGASALAGGVLGTWWYHSRVAVRSRATATVPPPTAQPAPTTQAARFLPERQTVYEEFFIASSAAFMAVGNYQLAQRKSDGLVVGDASANGMGAAVQELGRMAEHAIERVRLVSYRLEMRDVPGEIIEAVREYVDSMNGILALHWIPAEMHLSEERVRRLMRADLDFEPSGTEDAS
jgi:hypothetical protein